MIRLLLVEDDKTIAGIIKYYLTEEEEGYEVVWAASAGQALAAARDQFDVILLDIMLPDVSGIDLCAQLRKWHSCPVLFISCVDNSETIIRALEMGGDDYIVKPFDNRVLDARIQANLRRARQPQGSESFNTLECRGFTLDASTHQVYKGEQVLQLVPMEFSILSFLMQHPGQTFSAGELYKKVWGKPSYGDVRTVTVHIFNLRKKIEDINSLPCSFKRERTSACHSQNILSAERIFFPFNVTSA